jgi:hypothetical protein
LCIILCKVAITKSGRSPVKRLMAVLGAAIVTVFALQLWLRPTAMVAAWASFVAGGWAVPLVGGFILLATAFVAQWFVWESVLFTRAAGI